MKTTYLRQARFHRCEQSAGLDPQTFCESKHRIQRRLTNPPLQQRDIGGVQFTFQSQGFLRQTRLLPPCADLIAKRLGLFISFSLCHGPQRDPKRTFRLTDYSLWIVQTIVCERSTQKRSIEC